MAVFQRDFVSVIALLFALGTIDTVSARGFCNADHVGDDEQQNEVAKAAAEFYKGASHLMEMLSSYETASSSGMAEEAKAATGSFQRSASAYREAADLYDGILLDNFDEQSVAKLALTSRTPLFSDVITLGSKGASTLLSGCGDAADEVANATQEFASKVEGNTSTSLFSALLHEFSRALYFGRAVSSIFANSGGEKPNN